MGDHRDNQNLDGVFDAYEAEVLATADQDLLDEATETDLVAARNVLETALALAAVCQPAAPPRRRRAQSRTTIAPAVLTTRRRPEQMRATFSSEATSGTDDADSGELPE
jgi:hypothetical protein